MLRVDALPWGLGADPRGGPPHRLGTGRWCAEEKIRWGGNFSRFGPLHRKECFLSKKFFPGLEFPAGKKYRFSQMIHVDKQS
ncbi:hypothetical protein M2352_004448 [Azospirillum fermentarium]|uniref:hypothetical protein n=1 Tax=Azospirillum fermentarium TaxID=1233114 RepID=UPI00222803FC|nr:hypothetical protein [Azospirillum fermentarium]MCW2248788.1 hypothetical protein [Azospirillum fermentarium]